MLRRIAQYIVKLLVSKNKIEIKDTELYRYGLELIISNLTALIIVCIVGYVTGYFEETLIFIVIFYVLRKYGGGYHAKTMFRCMLLTMIVHIFLIIVLTGNLFENYFIQLWGVIIVIYSLFVPQNSDIDNQLSKYKLINYLLLLTGIIISSFLKNNSIVLYAFLVTALANLVEGGESMLKLIKKIAIKNINNCSPWEFFKPEKPAKRK